MTVWIENQRFLCPACQRNWTGARGVACEPCHAEALREGAQGEERPRLDDEPRDVDDRGAAFARMRRGF